MIRVGIVGLGHVAAHQIEALEWGDNLQLVAGCDPDTNALLRLPETASPYEQLEQLLDDHNIDVVVVASPNELHVEHAKQIIAAGKWLVLEKPMAASRKEAAEITSFRNELNARCTIALHAAFGIEVQWVCEQLNKGTIDCGSIARITSGFYDPYIIDGKVLDHARSLSGSWLDSGINALSVIDRLIPGSGLRLTDSRMTRIAASGCTEVQGSIEYRFRSASGTGEGFIDTNWTIGRNSKVTSLHMQDNKTTIVIDHSAQRVILQEGESTRELFRCDNGRQRLTNHYTGVFADLARQMRNDADNFEKSAALHDIVYAAEEW